MSQTPLGVSDPAFYHFFSFVLTVLSVFCFQFCTIFGYFWFNFSLFWQLVDAVETCLEVFLFIVFELSFATPSRGGLTPGL